MTEPLSRNAFAIPDGLTLEILIASVEADRQLDVQRRRNVASSIRTFCKAIGKEPRHIPAHASFIRRHLKKLHPAQSDLRKSRISNIRSDLLFALNKFTPGMSGSYLAAFTPAWQLLWDIEVTPKAIYDRRSASRLMHMCSAQNIDPDGVDDTVAETLLQSLINESLVTDPRGRWKKILYAWNKLVDRVPQWPQRKLSIPDDSGNYTFPLNQFPQSLQDEIKAAMDRWSAVDILDTTGLDKPLAPTTLKKRLVQFRELASGLVLNGWAIEDVDSIAHLVEISSAKSILRFFIKRAGDKTTSRIHGLAIMIKTLAKYVVGVDEGHLHELVDLCNRVDPKTSGMTEKNRDRLRSFDDTRNVGLLLSLPILMVEQVLREDQGLERDALVVQKALAVEILIMAPMRLKNLSGLNIERHIRRTRATNGEVHLAIPGEEVKNGEPLDFPLPAETVRLLDLYLSRFRPRLCSPANTWLFPGRSEEAPKSGHTLSIQLKRFVYEHTGLEINVHLYRHLTAKFYLDQNPGQYENVRRHLGHRSMETTIKAYAGMETAAASRHFDNTILKLRSSVGNKAA